MTDTKDKTLKIYNEDQQIEKEETKKELQTAIEIAIWDYLKDNSDIGGNVFDWDLEINWKEDIDQD